jgi:alpha-amylase
MKKIYSVLIALLTSVSMMGQGWPENYEGVMLQGFYWDSYTDTQWTNLEKNSDELSQYFNLIWVPNSGNCNTTYNVMGYAPVYWFNHNSSFGTEAQLRSMIKTYKQKNVGIIEDVVINHRNGVTGWVDFPAETWNGVTYQLTANDICSDDEAASNGYTVGPNKDTGEGWSGMRDLDHTSDNVQKNVNAYLDFLQNDLGYAGFRYDFVKGYAPKYTGLYNSTANAKYSVGEYWDGNLALVEKWIDGTKVNNVVQSAAFDFPLKYVINNACNSNVWSNLSSMGLARLGGYKRYAVTFVDNHDSYRDDNKCSSNIQAANAYILSMPGTPCVFLYHWNKYKSEIKQMIEARRLAELTNQSDFTEMVTSQAVYAGVTTGKSGHKLLYVLGGGSYNVPANYVQVTSGLNYKQYLSNDTETPWVSLASGSYDQAQTVTLTAISATPSATLVYTLDGSTPTAASTQVASGSTLNITEGTTTLKVGLLVNGVVKSIISRTYVIVPFTAHTATIYLKNPNWSKVCFYAWDATGTINDSWPGKTITDTKSINGEQWYYRTFNVNTSDYTFNIIFDKGSSDDQTIDIGPLNADTYYEVSAEKTNGKYTVTDVTDQITGISNVTVDASSNIPTKVYSLDGQLLRSFSSSVDIAKATEGLHKGVYIVNNKKYVVK